MTDTPLSDVMSAHGQANTAQTYAAFVELFRNSLVGIVGVGALAADGRAGEGFAAGRTTYSDGLSRVLAFADPAVASRAPGSQCNAAIPGAVLLQMAAGDSTCAGILVNSATEPISIVISRESAAAAQSPV